ncbi:MAG: copper amine oxidase N-terminal domain-containing protein [Armatimonadota bacterium]
MELSPVTRYRQPDYPTRAILADHPELLRAAPVRWQRSAVLASVLAASLALVLPARAGDDVEQPDTLETYTFTPDCSLIDTDVELRLQGDVAAPVAPVPQGITTLATLTLTPPDRAIRDGNVLTVPVRLVAGHLGAQVHYDMITGTTTVTRGDMTLVLTTGYTAFANGKAVPLPAPVRYRKPALYAPVRFLAERLGGQVEWNEQTDEILIISEHKGRMRLKALDRHAEQPLPEHPAVTQDQRRAALRDYVAWLKAQEMV